MEKGWDPTEVETTVSPLSELGGDQVTGKTLSEAPALEVAAVEMRGERYSAVNIEGVTHWVELE